MRPYKHFRKNVGFESSHISDWRSLINDSEMDNELSETSPLTHTRRYGTGRFSSSQELPDLEPINQDEDDEGVDNGEPHGNNDDIDSEVYFRRQTTVPSTHSESLPILFRPPRATPTPPPQEKTPSHNDDIDNINDDNLNDLPVSPITQPLRVRNTTPTPITTSQSTNRDAFITFPGTLNTYNSSNDADNQLIELLTMNETLQDELFQIQQEVHLLREYQADNTDRILREATSEQNQAFTQLRQEREQLATEKKDLTVLLEEISGGLETLEGFRRRKVTEAERSAAEELLREPKEDFVHVAVVGARAAGRGSFVNAIRGMHMNVAGCEFAPVGEDKADTIVKQECNLSHKGKGKQVDHGGSYHAQKQGYKDCRPGMEHIIFYELPSPVGAPILPWDYFNSEGMFAFDVIILLIGDSGHLQDTDIAILQQARYRKDPIPVFLVKMKADIGIQNILNDSDRESCSNKSSQSYGMGVVAMDSDDDGFEGVHIKSEDCFEAQELFDRQRWLTAKESYSEIAKTRVASYLARYRGLDPEKRVYLVSKKSVAEVSLLNTLPHAHSHEVAKQLSTRLVDEEDLYKDLTRTIKRIWKGKCQQQGISIPPPLTSPSSLNFDLKTPALHSPHDTKFAHKRDVVVLSSPSAAVPKTHKSPAAPVVKKEPVPAVSAVVTVKKEKSLKRSRSDESSELFEADGFEVLSMADAEEFC